MAQEGKWRQKRPLSALCLLPLSGDLQGEEMKESGGNRVTPGLSHLLV